MQRHVNRAAGAAGRWRAAALALSVLALAVNGYALTSRSTQPAARSTGSGARNPEHAAEERRAPEPSIAQVQALVEHGDAAALDTLLAAARSTQHGLVTAAIDGIAHIGGDRARQFLIERLAHSTDAELYEVAGALATLGDAKARDALRDATHSPRKAIRDAAFGALAGIDTADVRELMLNALNGPDPFSAVNYFLDCREPRALPALEHLARVSSPDVGRSAIDALLAQGASAQSTLERLLHDDVDLFDAILATPPRAVGGLRAVRAAGIARLREGAVAAGPLFEFLERDLTPASREALVEAARDPASRDLALSALARRADSASLAALSQLSNDSDESLSVRATCALASDPDSRSRVPLLRATRSNVRARAANALVKINAPGARPI